MQNACGTESSAIISCGFSCLPSITEWAFFILLFILLPCAVLEGMDVVYKVEAVGSGSGKTSKKVIIADSGEIKVEAS